MRLCRAILFVKDLERMSAFYRDALQLTPVAKLSEGGFRVLASGDGAQLALHAIPAAVAQQLTLSTPPKARTETAIKLVFEVPDVAAAREALTRAGAELRQQYPWG